MFVAVIRRLVNNANNTHNIWQVMRIAVALGYITLPLGGAATIVLPSRSLLSFTILTALALATFSVEAMAAARVCIHGLLSQD
jgi:hypothetical protein